VDWVALLAAFGGGVLGAAMGAVPVFIFTGLLAIVGVAAAAGGSTDLLQVAFGPVLGPHISFGGGVAAAAYAGSRGCLKTGRDIASALMGLGRMDVLVVGGLFGSLGYVVLWALTAAGIAPWTDAIALTVVISNIAARLLFGRTGLFGTVSTPLGQRFRPDDSASWLPWQETWPHVAFIGVAIGLAGAFLVAKSGLGSGRESLGFGISTVILTFLVMGNKVPVTHHISLPAALGVVNGGGVVVGALCGLIGALIGEIASRAMLIHGDTHIDPPAVAIAAVATLLALSRVAGVVLPPF
jgi:hypothetical protein